MDHQAYITGFGIDLPGPAIDNDSMDEYLGVFTKGMEDIRDSVLRLNGIESRHYAKTKDGETTHLCEDMGLNSSLAAIKDAGLSIADIDLIVAATTVPDVFIPAFGQQLHGRLGEHGMGQVQCVTSAGVCLAGLTALEDAALRIQLGKKQCALVTATERPSALFLSSHYEAEVDNRKLLKQRLPNYNFIHTAFLRWMLSDGSGSFIIKGQPKDKGISLRIDWIDIMSHADETYPVMYMGTNNNQNITPQNVWLGQKNLAVADREGMVNIRQDPNLLQENLSKMGEMDLERIIASGKLNPEEITHILPHFSSFAFEKYFYKTIADLGYDVKKYNWFTNLKTKGNTGCASIFIMLEECVKKGMFKDGEKILLYVPESARASAGFVQLTCVEK